MKEGDLVRLISPDVGSGYDEYTAIVIRCVFDRTIFPFGSNKSFYEVLYDGKVMDVDGAYWTVTKVESH